MVTSFGIWPAPAGAARRGARRGPALGALWALGALAPALAGCGQGGGVPDSELGDLVVARPAQDHPIDVALASREVRELGRAVAMPHSRLAGLLGPHRLLIKSRLEVTEPAQGGRVVEQLADETTLSFASPQAWRGAMDNSADYGREVLFLDGNLYLRARYQRWHQRPPTDEREPDALRDRLGEPAAATWELLAPGIAITDQGAATFAGKPAHKLALSTAARPQKPAREPLAQRKWRESRTVEGIEGELTLDAQSGALYQLSLRGTVGFRRDGRTFSMKLSVQSEVVDLGRAPPLAAPADDDVVQTPGRLHEVDERDRLLDGIAPPLRAERGRAAKAPAAPAPTSASPSAPTPAQAPTTKP